MQNGVHGAFPRKALKQMEKKKYERKTRRCVFSGAARIIVQYNQHGCMKRTTLMEFVIASGVRECERILGSLYLHLSGT